MTLPKLGTFLWAATATLALFATAYAPGQEPATQPSKDALRPDNWEEFHRLIRLQPGEFRWDEVPWFASLWHARKKAAAEDKPILVFGTGGAGFNDPLGNC